MTDTTCWCPQRRPDETRCGYAGWNDGEARCDCGAHFTSMQAFEQHVGMPVADETNPFAPEKTCPHGLHFGGFYCEACPVEPKPHAHPRAVADETNAGGLSEAESVQVAPGKPQGGMKSERGQAAYWRMQWESCVGALADLIAEHTETVGELTEERAARLALIAGIEKVADRSVYALANRSAGFRWGPGATVALMKQNATDLRALLTTTNTEEGSWGARREVKRILAEHDAARLALVAEIEALAKRYEDGCLGGVPERIRALLSTTDSAGLKAMKAAAWEEGFDKALGWAKHPALDAPDNPYREETNA